MHIGLLGLYAAGRLDLAVYANFGAFAAIHGGPARTRWRTQATVGIILTLLGDGRGAGSARPSTPHDRLVRATHRLLGITVGSAASFTGRIGRVVSR